MRCRRALLFTRLLTAAVAFCLSLSGVGTAARGAQGQTATIPAPRDVLGFTPGEDRRLASWAQFVDYFQRLDRASDRVLVQELGKTTLGRPFLLTIISSPANLARLDYYREIQRKLADPRILGSGDSSARAAKLIADGRTIVLVTCGIHSTEVGANLVAPMIAHRLASDTSPEVREILDNCIVLLVPSLNPDGVDIVTDWYRKTLGTPSEGTGPPQLYHHYTGHDNNRDWYAFTQIETQLTVDKVHNVWHPQIVHDIHQQGQTGSRMFLPPYTEPWEPNVPPLIQAGVNFLGMTMAWELAAENKAGVMNYSTYDAWTPARAYQHYHGGIRILSETASAQLATPVTIPLTSLNSEVRERNWNFPLVWPGGEWRLANIVDYMQSAAFALLRGAARYRDRWVRGFYQIGQEAVTPAKPGAPFAFLLPPPPDAADLAGMWQSAGLSRIEAILRRGGVEQSSADLPFTAGGVQYPAGTRIVRMDQPYAAFARTLLERQRYPDLREYPGGPPRRPYDVTAHTLPLLMGARAVRIDTPFPMPPLRSVPPETFPAASLFERRGITRLGLYRSHVPVMDEGWTRWFLDDFRVPYTSMSDAEIRAGGLRARYDTIILPSQSAASIINGLPASRYPANISGGLGSAGIAALAAFVEAGGTLIALEEASDFAIEHLGVPVKNILKGVSPRVFYCPGSILKIRFAADDPLARGVPPLEGTPGEGIAWFEGSGAFEPTGDAARVVARFGEARELLLSGWLLGAKKIANKGAIVKSRRGRGRIVLFAFRPQYRGQSLATLPFLFNAIGQNGNGTRNGN